MHPDTPPIQINAQGEIRHVGFELEYTGISLEESALLMAELFNGEIKEETRSNYRVDTPALGTFTVKLDMSMMQKISADAAQQRLLKPEVDNIDTVLESVLAPIVSSWMPNEIVTPPLPLPRIAEMDGLGEALKKRGGKGTAASPLYAFGLHINAEMPAIAPEELRDYIAAFILLQDWLKEKAQMDISRQIAPYARLFSSEYAAVVLNPGYRPPITQLIDDYLEYNPTRNRALDMLPLFCMFDEERVRRAVDDPRVRKRPAFHYRLPNCDLDIEGWSIITEWNRWVRVERLAEDKLRLNDMARSYLSWLQSPVDVLLGSWAQESEQWVAA